MKFGNTRIKKKFIVSIGILSYEKLNTAYNRSKTCYGKIGRVMTEEMSQNQIDKEQVNLPPGLTKNEVQELLRAGKGNAPLKKNTRSVGRIILDNTFTLFNLINGILAVVVFLVCLFEPKYFRNMLFMGVVVANTAIISFHEIRAKITIDRLSILTEPHALVRRGGEEFSISVEEIVPGDLLKLSSGQQISVDGHVIYSDSMEVDESLLTGESDGIRKKIGDPVLSGSVVMSGFGYIQVEKVSKDTFAARITQEVKEEKRQLSPLMHSLNQILKYISIVMFPLGAVLLVKVYLSSTGPQMLRGIVATSGLLVSMLPEGLILLTSIAMAVSVLRMGQKKALVQKIPSIEMLARVDVLCLDKTGTITSGNMDLLGLADLKGKTLSIKKGSQEADLLANNVHDFKRTEAFPPELSRALSSFCQVFPQGNATQEALSKAFLHRDGNWIKSGHIAFSSQRKWSAASFKGKGTWYVGAAEMLLDPEQLKAYSLLIKRIALGGYRLLLLAHSPQEMDEDIIAKAVLLPQREALAFLILADEIRPDVEETFQYFHEQGVEIKVISGDHPYTLEAIAKRAGIPDYDQMVDMSQYPEDADYSSLLHNRLFGRVSPFQKRGLLKALQAEGHTVAMTGDGVNDVLALKDADCGVAMASGSDAARSAADIVLLDNRMSLMVDAVYEGRRVINNIQRVASLFLIKTIYASLFALAMLPLPIVFPILPIQGTLINSVTVGIPSFVLALKSNRERVSGNFLANVLPLAWPAGLTGAMGLVALQILRKPLGLTPEQLSTYAMFVLISLGLRALFKASKPFDLVKALTFGLSMGLPIVVTFFFSSLLQLALPPQGGLAKLGGILLAALLLAEFFYWLSRTGVLRDLSRSILGNNREDLLQEEQKSIKRLQQSHR